MYTKQRKRMTKLSKTRVNNQKEIIFSELENV